MEPGKAEFAVSREAAHPGASAPRTYWGLVWTQFRKNAWGRVALWVVAALFLIATYAPVVALDVPFWLHDARDGTTRWPWFGALFDRHVFENFVDIVFNVLMFLLPVAGVGAVALRRAGRRVSLWCWGCGVCAIAACAGLQFWPSSSPYRDFRADVSSADGRLQAIFPVIRHSFRRQHIAMPSEPPLTPRGAEAGATFLLGTDRLGRDVFTRMLYGTRVSLTIGVFAVSIYVAIGIVLGALAGYFGGWADLVVSRLIEIMTCFPTFFLILTLAAFVPQRTIFDIMFIIGITSWPGVARLVRAEFLKQRALDYVAAARGLGVPAGKIIGRHVLPNAIAPVLVAATFGVAGAILTESGLSFLGLGDDRSPSWGQLLTMGRETWKWWMIHVPGIAIFITVSALNTVGDAFRDAIDPRMKI